MHQIQKDKFEVVSPTAFSKSETEVQRKFRAILDLWGDDGANWASNPYERGVPGHCVRGAWNTCHGSWLLGEPERFMKQAAQEMGFGTFGGEILCSDSSFENARKMVLRAIELAA